MIGFYYRLNREERRRRRSGKTHIDISQMHPKTKNRDQRICHGNEMHSKNAFIHNVCKCINWQKFTEFVSGMWELFRSLGFTSTSLSVCVFFPLLLRHVIRIVIAAFLHFLSSDDFHRARNNSRKKCS